MTDIAAIAKGLTKAGRSIVNRDLGAMQQPPSSHSERTTDDHNDRCRESRSAHP